MVKYRSRALVSAGKPSDTWTHADVLNLMHPHPASQEHAQLMNWAVAPQEKKLRLAFEMNHEAKSANMIRAYHEIMDGNPSITRIAGLLLDYNLPWEVLPTDKLNSFQLWKVLLPTLGARALLRQTWRFEEQGFFKDHSFREVWALRMLDERVIKGKIHPIDIYIALKARQHDKFVREILDSAFDKAMHLPLDPVGKRLIIAIDASGSMSKEIMMSKTARESSHISCWEASMAMSSVFIRHEATTPLVLSWSDGERSVRETRFSSNKIAQMVTDFLSQAKGGGTDMSSPLRYVVSQGLAKKYDGMLIFTDDETWKGPELPMTWLRQVWRINPNFKMITCSVAAYEFTNFVRDPRTLDTAGFDSSLHQIVKSMFE
jgi:hypothetical protein